VLRDEETIVAARQVASDLLDADPELAGAPGLAAEVARLEALGATVQSRHDTWAVLTDPGGLVFCVVPVWTDRADFDRHATTWGA